MKRFLYYNQDSVNSFLAQIEQGLLVKEDTGKEQSETQSSTMSDTTELTGDLSAKVVGIGAAVKGNMITGETDSEAATTLIQNIQEKVLHDFAFDRVYNYVLKNDLINNTDQKIGDIILVKEVPTFLDFNYFKSLFAENGAVKFGNDQNKKKVDEIAAALKGSSVQGTQGAILKKQMEDLKKTINKGEEERKEMLRTFDAIGNTLPYNRFVMTTNMLMPLDDENFRDNPDIIAFKYGGEISILGYVTNIISENETPERNNDYAPLYDTINKVMLNMFKGQDKIYIVHPIALFY